MAERRNILHVITHDSGRHLGCYGADVRTPCLDRLASEGVRFSRCFCAAPQCSPSRAAMFSGMMPHNNGMIGLAHRGFSIRPEVRADYLPAVLGRAGYHTALFGLQHESEKIYTEPEVSTRGPKSLGYRHVHQPEPPEHRASAVLSLLDRHLQKGIPEPFFVSAGTAETHRRFPVIEQDPERLRVPGFLPDHPEVRKDVAGLNAKMEEFDRCLGPVLDTLQRTGLDRRTLVVVTTDHGIPFPGAKSTLLDPGLEIFQIARGPGGFEGGRAIDALLSNIDLMPTLLDFAGVPVPPGVQGRSFLPVVRGEAPSMREELFAELTYHAAYDPMRALRTNRYKYIRSFEVRPEYFALNIDDGPTKSLLREQGAFQRLRPFEQLFDLEPDPLERRNLAEAPEHRKTLETLRQRLIGWMKETGDPILEGPVNAPPEAILSVPWGYSPHEVWFDKKHG